MTDEPVEFAANDEDSDGPSEINQFGQAVLWATDWTVETVLAQLRRQNIELNPRFQRRDAWSRIAKSRFIESIILGLPIPQVVLAESREERGRYIILDGKQRLLSLMQFAGTAEGTVNKFSLSGLEVRTDLSRKRFRNLEEDAFLRPELNAFLNHTIRTIVIRNWPSLSFLHVVFQRLNTGSLKLSPQELRQAVAPGPFTYFVDDITIDAVETRHLLGNSRPDPRMRDVELIVRAISFKHRLVEYTGRMKDFLDDTCIYFNDNWNQLEAQASASAQDFLDGIRCLEEIFGYDKIARKLHSKLFNRSIFDPLIYFAMDQNTRGLMADYADRVKNAYDAVIQDQEFQAAVESDTAGIPHTEVRFRVWGRALAEAIGQSIQIPETSLDPDGRSRFRA